MTLHAILSMMPPAPTSLTDKHLHHITSRVNGIRAVERSRDYQVLVLFFPDNLPPGPDPFNVTAFNKRPWEKAMEQWRRQLRERAAESLAGELFL